MFYRDGKFCCYSIVLQDVDDFSSELEELRQITMPVKTVEHVTVENWQSPSEVSANHHRKRQLLEYTIVVKVCEGIYCFVIIIFYLYH